VNGDIVNIPSYHLRPGDVVAVREKSKSLEAVTNSVSAGSVKNYPWLDFDKVVLSGTFIVAPTRDQMQLQEKQKAKYTYGILERQFSNLFAEASRRKGTTGENLLILCESRLDNTVFRLGIAPTRSGGRQLVSHRHITVNGDIVNIPSYHLRPGDVVAVREKSKSLEAVTNSVSAGSVKNYSWLDFDKVVLSGTFIVAPTRDQIPENIREQLIVELYSK